MRSVHQTEQDGYIDSLAPVEGELKNQSREFSKDLGLERISVARAEAQLIKTLIQIHGAKKFIEIGTLTGLSAQYILEALPNDGELWTLEKDPKHAECADKVFSQIEKGSKKIHLVVGDAREKLKELSSMGPFDGIFIDGNKAAYLDYLLWAEENLRSGGLVLADNIFLSGAVWGAETTQKFSEKQIRIMNEFNARLSDPARYQSAIVPTYEGLYIALKI